MTIAIEPNVIHYFQVWNRYKQPLGPMIQTPQWVDTTKPVNLEANGRACLEETRRRNNRPGVYVTWVGTLILSAETGEWRNQFQPETE